MSADIIMVVEDGKDMKGECQDSQFKDAIELQTWDWDFTQRGRFGNAGQPSGGESSAGERGSSSGPSINNSLEVTDLKVTKFADLATAKMMHALFKKKTLTKLDIYTRKMMQAQGGMLPKPYLHFSFTNARFSSLSFSDQSRGTLALEEWKISFEQVKIIYVQQGNDNMAGKTPELEWSVPWLKDLQSTNDSSRRR